MGLIINLPKVKIVNQKLEFFFLNNVYQVHFLMYNGRKKRILGEPRWNSPYLHILVQQFNVSTPKFKAVI